MGSLKLLVLALLLAKGQAPHFKVIRGLKHSSITLSTSFNPRSVKEVAWCRKTPKGEWRIAKIQNGHLTEPPNERYQLTHGGTRLVIDNLDETDNGVYRAEATLGDATIEQEFFNVTVHEPVPPPHIISKMKRIGDQCNITLQCSVPSNTSDVSYTWKYRRRDSEKWREENDTSTMQRILPQDQHMEFVCIVHNPDDQKNVSFLYEHCSGGMAKRHRLYTLLPIIISIVLGIAILSCSIWKGMNTQVKGKTTARAYEMTAVSCHPPTEASRTELEGLKISVLETGTQESFFIGIIHKNNESMKNKESDEEGYRLKDKPSCNRSSVIKVESPEEVEIKSPEEVEVESSEEVEIKSPE